MTTPNKDLEKVEVRIKWDPSDQGETPNDLDIIAATYPADEPYGSPRVPRALRQPGARRHDHAQPRQQDGGRGGSATTR